MRHALSRAPASAAALAAVMLSAAWPAPAVAASDPIALPVVRSSLAADEPCAAASGQVAEVEPWPVRALGLARAGRVSEGAGVTVAVVDTGVGAGVPSLAGRVRHLGPADQDCVGHGSFAAGLIAGAPLPGVGTVGVAPAARLLAVRGTDERGVATPESLAGAIRAAADEGAGVVYVASALATGAGVLTDAVAYAARKDALVVAPFAPDLPPDAGGASPRRSPGTGPRPPRTPCPSWTTGPAAGARTARRRPWAPTSRRRGTRWSAPDRGARATTSAPVPRSPPPTSPGRRPWSARATPS